MANKSDKSGNNCVFGRKRLQGTVAMLCVREGKKLRRGARYRVPLLIGICFLHQVLVTLAYSLLLPVAQV
ncbi:MAG: hypothetical protein PUI13_03820, partial [Paraprevotella sp.]|nr:hypothetical protein [Paraprevotella sp.]MDY5265023.1 hypothetical protein [Bacteroidaceae bacterium]